MNIKKNTENKLFKRNISERQKDSPHFKDEFGPLQGDSIVNVYHKSTAITLVERVLKAINTLKSKGHKVKDIETAVNQWFQSIPKKLFKSITSIVVKNFLIKKYQQLKPCFYLLCQSRNTIATSFR